MERHKQEPEPHPVEPEMPHSLEDEEEALDRPASEPPRDKGGDNL